ncbi:MAG: cation-translocating P-type ATPase [Eggerthellaceae bacterium]|nr:cation-translocating P-type ATPase [Eggerthellaceae bacterium]
MANGDLEYSGLSSAEAQALKAQYGSNELSPQKKENFLVKLLHIVSEPMFLLLIIAAAIYFILGEPRDGAIMLIFVVGIISIEAFQEWKTDKTLLALKDLSAPHVTVVRDGAQLEVASADLVPGDIMMVQEGVKVPADGVVLRCSDLRVDESSLTGEPEGVWKTAVEEGAGAGAADASGYWRRDLCYAGTLVTQGFGVVRVEKTGAATEYGKIGANIAEAPQEKTPLQKQTGALVRLSAFVAAVLCVLVAIVTWFNIPEEVFTSRLVGSVLSGVTLAMAMIPEEFPVIMAVFLSMGAWRLAKKSSLVRRLPSVETLGAVSVLCVDKTGTITMNQMSVVDTWAFSGGEEELTEVMGLACETDAYDPMENAMLDFCEARGIGKDHLFGGELISEYAFTNELKMMGHVWRHEGEVVIAAKGSPESIVPLCHLDAPGMASVERQVAEMGGEGLRVIALASAKLASEADIPDALTGCSLQLCGLVGLADPPRESVKGDIAICNRAGIRVVMITGDNGITASAIARQVGIPGSDNVITGDMLEGMSEEELREQVKSANIFSRVIPEHKMRIVKAFKENGAIVAMTGDGVNDAPALKYADIGIAMGKRGSEVSREAADLILLDDNFSTIVETVRDGRRIYDNIRKAFGYVLTIHIPIAFASLLAPMLGVFPESLMLLPLQVVLLELVIDPTCSIVLERQPAEADIMERRPRNPKENMLNAPILVKSIAQGLVLFAASFGMYYLMLRLNPENAPLARSMGLAVIMLGNLFLVQVNSSTIDSFITSARRLGKDRVMWAINIATLVGLAAVLYTPLNEVLRLAPLSAGQAFAVIGAAAISVLWYELVKMAKRAKRRHLDEGGTALEPSAAAKLRL